MSQDSPLTLSEWRQFWLGGESPRAVLQALRRRLSEESPPEVWISRLDEAGLAAQCDALEAAMSRHGDRAALLREMPLFGVPFAVKDNIDVAGFLTTAACPAYARPAAADAPAVARLRAAGAICMGKTNLDQFATGLVGARSPFGRPSSVFDPARVSGGSSSGSAVCVARGEVAFSLGTDTAGSGRVPAGFNNIVGLKPTPGRVGTTGVLPACRTLDCISVFALTVADAAEILALIEGPDEADSYWRPMAGPASLPDRLRIAVPARPGFDASTGYGAAFARAIEQARAMGHTIEEIDFDPLFAVASLLYDGPWVAERHAVVQGLLKQDPEAIDPTVRRVIEVAEHFSATDTFRAQYRLRDAQRDTAELWKRFDVLMVPTAPHHPTHAEIDADPLGANARLGTYTNFVNLLGWSALALPAGFTGTGLPFGVTFIGPVAGDAALARFGQAWEKALGLTLGSTGRKAGASSSIVAWPATQATLPVVVVGAHLSGMPLNRQLTERGGRLRLATETSANYRLYALPGTTPPKPGLQRVVKDGAAIAVEVWDLPAVAVGSFLAEIPPPLGLGSLELADGSLVHGFICEGYALDGARDITSFGGWRAFIASNT